MSYGPIQVFNVAIASGTSTSSLIDLGKSQRQLACYVTTMTTNAMITIYGCATATGTFKPVFERVNTAPVQHQIVTIATSTSGNWWVIDAPPFQYLKMITSATVTDGGLLTVLASD